MIEGILIGVAGTVVTEFLALWAATWLVNVQLRRSQGEMLKNLNDMTKALTNETDALRGKALTQREKLKGTFTPET